MFQHQGTEDFNQLERNVSWGDEELEEMGRGRVMYIRNVEDPLALCVGGGRGRVMYIRNVEDPLALCDPPHPPKIFVKMEGLYMEGG